MNEPHRDAAAKIPTPEQLVGRKLRLLRQSRGWSQLEAAERMRPYGYQWSQATVTRLEAATRPIRLNELNDLATLYGVPVTQLLASDAPDDLEDLETEIRHLSFDRERVVEQLHGAESTRKSATEHAESLRADLARIEWRLEALARWHPAARQAKKSERGGGGR